MNTFQISSPLTMLSWLDLTWNCIPPVKKTKNQIKERLILSSAANNSPKLLMLLRWWSTTHNSLHSRWRVTNHQQCRTPEWEQEELWMFSERKDTDDPCASRSSGPTLACWLWPHSDPQLASQSPGPDGCCREKDYDEQTDLDKMESDSKKTHNFLYTSCYLDLLVSLCIYTWLLEVLISIKNIINEETLIKTLPLQFIQIIILLIGATEEGQVVLVDILGDVKAVGLDQLLVLCQLILMDSAE